MLPTSTGHNITYRFTKYTTNYMKNQNICTKPQEFLQQIFEIKQSRRNSYERGARINLLSTLGTQIFTWGSWKRKKPRVRRCKLLCGLLRGRAASLPKRTIVGRFRAVLGKLPVRRNRSRRKALALFCAIASHSSPQCGLSQGFAGYDKWRFFRGLRNGLTPIFEKTSAKPRAKRLCGGAAAGGFEFQFLRPKN